MAYVDLNPIRAQMAETPESSDHTSIQKRIKEVRQTPKENNEPYQPVTLFKFVGNPREPMPEGLPFTLKDYIELVDWTGRIECDDKRGAIDQKTPAILTRLKIEQDQWLKQTRHIGRNFTGFIGTVESIRKACSKLNYSRMPRPLQLAAT